MPDVVRSTKLAIGSLLNSRYRLDAEMGQGGMGVVFRAYDTLLERGVALKILSKAGLGTEGRVRLLREARSAAQLNHANIVGIYDAGEVKPSTGARETLPFIVMELVEGESLFDRPPETLDQIIAIARQICAALEHAHANGIVHRDLKPENIIVCPDGSAKLTDFGLARPVASRLTTEGTISGTVFYVAPEQALGRRLDGRADLYALGVLLYELTTGQLPFTGDDPLTVISQHLHAPVIPPRARNPQIPPALDALIQQLLSKEPDARPSSAAEVLETLEEIARSSAVLDSAIPSKSLPSDELMDWDQARAEVERSKWRPAVAHNLPPQPTAFVGRERELAQLGDLIASPETRLITIVGPGGIGKTRLALAVAERQLNSVEAMFADGVHFVPLAGLSASDEMAYAVAEALDFQLGGPEESRSARQQVLDFLREKRMLLVLDNFEHLLTSPSALQASPAHPSRALRPKGEKSIVSPPLGAKYPSEAPGKTGEGERGGVSFVSDVLGTAPEVQLLVTSRERMPLREEQAFPITGLECADEASDDRVDYAAEQLFVQAARRAEPAFELATDEGATLSRVCRLLEGMPLGIELAATWVDVLSLADIAAEIQRGLDFLATEWQDAPERHRSVRAAIDATWRRLTETEQVAFAQLCVFRGGFTRQAAREVTGADLRTLARLVDKSLLRFSREQERYDVHELLRQFGCERLADEPELVSATRDRHSAYYCHALGTWGDAMKRNQRLRSGAAFEADWANLRSAWEWAADRGDASRLDLAADGMGYLFMVLRRSEDILRLGRRAFDGLTECPRHCAALTTRVLAKLHNWCCYIHFENDDWDLLVSHLRQAERLLEEPLLEGVDTRDEQAHLHVILGVNEKPDWEAVRWHFQQALALQRELGYAGEATSRLVNIGWTYLEQGNFTQARRHYEEAWRQSTAQGNELAMLQSLYMLGNLSLSEPNLLEAERFFRGLIDRADAFGSANFKALGMGLLAVCATLKGDYGEAEALLQDCAKIARRCGEMTLRCTIVRLLGMTAWFRGDVNVAASRFAEALGLAHQANYPAGANHARCWLSYTACAAGDYDRAEALCEEGIAGLEEHELSLRAVLNVALARVALFRGDTMLAVARFHECLQKLRLFVSRVDNIRALEGLSWALANLGRYGKTAQLLGFLDVQRERSGMILPPVDQPHHDRALRLAREGLSEEAFTSAWEAGTALTLEEAMNFALASAP